jgi:hypothetical protein
VAPAAARETYRESDVMSFICSSVNQHLRMIYYIVIDHRVSGQRNALPTTHTSSQYQHSQAKQKKKSKKKRKETR